MRQVNKTESGKIGSSFDEFLKGEGIFEEIQAGALQKVVAHRKRDEAAKADQGRDGLTDEYQPQPARPAARSGQRFGEP